MKDLPRDEMPDSADYQPVVRPSIREAMLADLEDESLTRYKEQLLGNLSASVQQSVNLATPIDRKCSHVNLTSSVC